MMFSVDCPLSSHQKPNHCTGRLHPVASCAPIRPLFGRLSPTSPFTTCIVKRTDAQRDCGLSHHALTILENRSIPWAYASQPLPPLYTQISGMEILFHPHLHSLNFHFPSTLPQPSTMEPAKGVAAGGAWDRLL
jgi:hypothetical protein